MSNTQENVDENAVAVSASNAEENVSASQGIKSEEVKVKKEKGHNWAKIFRPWKWKRKKKSEKFARTATVLERKISVRSSRDDLVKRGVLTNVNGPPSIPEQVEQTRDADRVDGSHHTDHNEASNKENSDMRKALLPSQHSSKASSDKQEAVDQSNGMPGKTTPPKPSLRSSKSLSQDIDAHEYNANVAQEKPVAAKRTIKTILPSGSHGNAPPKPPPKPGKQVNSQGDHNMDSPYPRSRAVTTGQLQKGSEVMFSANVDVIQQADETNAHARGLCKQNSIGGYESDSSGSILYRQDSDDDDEVPISGLAAKVVRRDTLALKLANRPDRKELEQRNIFSSPERTEEVRVTVKKNLTRHLSQRPTKSELFERNIIPNESEAERHKEREKVKRQLTRKLSMRPTVKELIDRKVLKWHEYVEVYEVQNYDRRGDKPWTRLTPSDKAHIRKELNEFKANEMEVHEDSKRFTRFHKP